MNEQRTQGQQMPRLLKALMDSLKLPDLRRRILFTLAMLVVFRFIAHVPVPNVDAEALKELFAGNQIWGMMDIFSGGAMGKMSIAALGVYPYITAVIIMQLLIPVIPRLRSLSQEGEWGRNKINQYTYWLTVPLALLQGYGTLSLFHQGIGGKPVIPTLWPFHGGDPLATIAMLLSLTAGTMFLVWLGERITESGIGNGVSIIIVGGIIAALPVNIWQTYEVVKVVGLLELIILMLAITFFIVYVTEAQRRIPVQYSRSVFRGGKMYRQTGGTHIPLPVNSAGMIPLIFAYAVIMLPAVIASYFPSNSFANSIQSLFGETGPFYWILLFVLVVGFTYFYTMVVFEQQDLAGTLKKQGGFIPGIRPGRPTSQYLIKVLTRITFGGATFLGAIAVMPVFAKLITSAPGTVSPSSIMILSSAGLLIVVAVMLDTMRQLESQLLMRHYEGFIK